MTLIAQPYRPLGAPAPLRSTALAARDVNTTQVSDVKGVDTVIVALRTLGEFDFSGELRQKFGSSPDPRD